MIIYATTLFQPIVLNRHIFLTEIKKVEGFKKNPNDESILIILYDLKKKQFMNVSLIKSCTPNPTTS